MDTIHHARFDLDRQLLERRAAGETYLVAHIECGIAEDAQSVVVYATLTDGTILTTGFTLPHPVPNPATYDTSTFEAQLFEMPERDHA